MMVPKWHILITLGIPSTIDFFIKLHLSGKEEVDVMIKNGYRFLFFICYYYINYEIIYLASSI